MSKELPLMLTKEEALSLSMAYRLELRKFEETLVLLRLRGCRQEEMGFDLTELIKLQMKLEKMIEEFDKSKDFT